MCAIGIPLHCQEHSVPRKGRREPHARVANRGANLQNALGPDGHGEHAEQRPHLRVNERKLRPGPLLRDCFEDSVASVVEFRQVALDSVWNNLAHN